MIWVLGTDPMSVVEKVLALSRALQVKTGKREERGKCKGEKRKGTEEGKLRLTVRRIKEENA